MKGSSKASKSSKAAKAKGGKKSAAKKPAAKQAAAKKSAARKPAAKKPTKAAAKKPTKAAAKKPAKAAAMKSKPAAMKPKAAASSKSAVKAKASSAKAKAASPKKGARNTVPSEHGTPLAEHAGKAMIIQILGDAEAFFFDFDRLGADRRAELIEHHLAAWDARKRGEGQPSWAETFVPVALLGESMPPTVRGQFDLSAPHAGVVLYHRPTGALLHSAGKDDEKLAVMAPDIETISPRASFLGDVFDPADQSYAYRVDASESDGFTRANIEMLMQTGGAELILV
jgi:hypothetical protein